MIDFDKAAIIGTLVWLACSGGCEISPDDKHPHAFVFETVSYEQDGKLWKAILPRSLRRLPRICVVGKAIGTSSGEAPPSIPQQDVVSYMSHCDAEVIAAATLSALGAQGFASPCDGRDVGCLDDIIPPRVRVTEPESRSNLRAKYVLAKMPATEGPLCVATLEIRSHDKLLEVLVIREVYWNDSSISCED